MKTKTLLILLDLNSMKKTLLLFAVLLGFISVNAQDNPFAEYGYEPEIATLSKGQFNESFDNDTIVQIGSVLFNTKSRQIVAFLEIDTMYSEATLEPDIVSRWISPDPLAAQFPSWSPYAYANNNPILFIDPDGRYAVSVHYNITYKSLLKLGYSKSVAKSVAHYASVYADHPSQAVLNADNLLHLTNLSYQDNINYSVTANSQAESNSMWHSMMSDEEAEGGMTHGESMQRGLEFGWGNIFTQKDGEDLGKLGQGLHALQDAYAHKGASTEEHLGTNLSSAKMVWNDMYGNTDNARLITESAGIVLQLFNGNSTSLKNGMTLDFSGMSDKQLNSVTGMLNNSGYNLKLGDQNSIYTLEQIKTE